MSDNKKNTNTDIVDFDLNEYDKEFEKEERRLKIKEEKKIAAEKSRAQKAKEQQAAKSKKKVDSDEPGRDMLKTILLILIVIVIACCFLGFIAFIANNIGTDGKSKTKDKTTEATTEATTSSYNPYEGNTSNTPDDQLQHLEESIEEITNQVQQDQTTQAPATEAPTTEATTQAPEVIQEEPTPEPAPETPSEPATEDVIDSQPAQ